MRCWFALLLAAALVACAATSAEAQLVYVTQYQPATVYYAPAPAVVVESPAPVVTYYRAPTVALQPVARVRTRYRPILGGTVSRVRYSYLPVVIP